MQNLLTYMYLKQDWINFRATSNDYHAKIVSKLSYFWSIEEAGKEATRLRSYISSTSSTSMSCKVVNDVCSSPWQSRHQSLSFVNPAIVVCIYSSRRYFGFVMWTMWRMMDQHTNWGVANSLHPELFCSKKHELRARIRSKPFLDAPNVRRVEGVVLQLTFTWPKSILWSSAATIK